MADSHLKELQEPQRQPATESSLRTILTAVVIIGVCAVLMMANMAFGLSGFGFAAVIVICVQALIAHRYRFNLRKLLLFMTVLSNWLGAQDRTRHAAPTSDSHGDERRRPSEGSRPQS